MRRLILALGTILVAAMLALSGCSGDGDPTPSTTPATSDARSASAPPVSPAPSPTTVTSQGLTVTPVVIDGCTPQGGKIKLESTGFSPGGEYETSAIRPDGSPYPGIKNPGHAAQDGSTPDWEWPCKGDLPGDYKITVQDTGREQVRSITFTITVHRT